MSLKGQYQKLPIRYKFIILFAVVFILAGVGGGMSVDYLIRKNLEQSIESELANTTEALLDMVKTSASASVKNRLRAIAEKNYEIVSHFHRLQQQGAYTGEDARMLAAQVLLSQTIGTTGYIFCVDSQGVMRVHPREGLLGVDVSGYENIRKQMESPREFLEYEWQNPGDPSPRAKSVYVMHFKPWDWFISVSCYRDELMDLVDPDDFREAVLERRFGMAGYSYVMDLTGKLLIHPKLEGETILDSEDADGRMYIREMCATRKGKIIYPWKNAGEKVSREKMLIFSFVPEFNWIVASSGYLSELYRPLRAIRTVIVLTVASSLIVVLFFVLYLSGMITRPLNELIDKMNTIGKPGFGERMPVTTTEEIGTLSRCFNRFMEHIEGHHRELENLVSQRTWELEGEINERSLVERKLREHSFFLKTFINTIPSPVFYKDRQGVYQACNQAFASMILGLSEAEIEGRTLFDLPDQVPRPLAETYHRKDKELMEIGGMQTYEHQVKCADGVIRDFQFSKATIRDDEGCVSGLAGVMQDITEINRAKQKIRRQAEEIAATNLELEKLASLDSLTGLNNRRVFQEQLIAHARLSWRRKSELSLIILDIDYFKAYNDTFGHPAGDEALVQAGRLLKAGARESDITSRYGGEEFAVILPDTGKEGALARARRFHHVFGKHPWPKRDITISCGVVTGRFGGGQDPISIGDIEDLIAQADKALYRSKQQGRNRTTHADDIEGMNLLGGDPNL